MRVLCPEDGWQTGKWDRPSATRFPFASFGRLVDDSARGLGTPRESSAPRVKKPATGSILLALIPFCGLCFSVPLWDRVTPTVMGLPFNLFWVMAWIAGTPLVLSFIYRIERRR